MHGLGNRSVVPVVEVADRGIVALLSELAAADKENLGAILANVRLEGLLTVTPRLIRGDGLALTLYDQGPFLERGIPALLLWPIGLNAAAQSASPTAPVARHRAPPTPARS